jgi:RNA polymerase sigma-70 factor (ECF subfamily)
MEDYTANLIEARDGLYRAARSRLRHADWAEEAVAETLLAALERRPEFDDPGRVRAWLFGILRHKVVDQLRLHMRTDTDGGELAEQALAETPAARSDPAQHACAAQFIADLSRALASLPRPQSRAFVLRESDGCSTCARFS